MATSPLVSLPNLNPSPQGGQGAYGLVPGPIGAPTSTYGQVSQIAPALPALTRSASSVVGSELAGEIAPETQQFLQQKAAEYGVSMGLPGSPTGPGFTGANYLRSLGLTAEGLQQQGIKDYGALLAPTAATQVSPETQASIAEQNAINAAAPDPAAAAQTMLNTLKNLYQVGGGKAPVGGVSGYDTSGASQIYGRNTTGLAPWQVAAGFKNYY